MKMRRRMGDSYRSNNREVRVVLSDTEHAHTRTKAKLQLASNWMTEG